MKQSVHINSMANGAATRDAVIQFHVLVMVPGIRADEVFRFYAELVYQRVHEFFASFIQISIRVTMPRFIG